MRSLIATAAFLAAIATSASAEPQFSPSSWKKQQAAAPSTTARGRHPRVYDHVPPPLPVADPACNLPTSKCPNEQRISDEDVWAACGRMTARFSCPGASVERPQKLASMCQTRYQRIGNRQVWNTTCF
jgi:hypothetical protein